MIYIQQANGLQPISQQLTKEKIITALGYTPADNTTLWEDKSGNLIVADENGYVIARIDTNGLETVGIRAESILLNGEDLTAKLDNLNNRDVDLTNYYTKDEVNKALSEVDINIDLSNYYTKEEVDETISNMEVDVDLTGYATENFVTQKIQESENNREEIDLKNYALSADVEANKVLTDVHIADEVVHVSAAERTLWNSKSDFSGNYQDLKNAPNITTNDNDDELIVCDSAGNVIMKVNANGINTADIFLNGESLEKKSPLAGKKVSILGNSISTYSGYLPSGYASWYPRADVNSVDKTWWKQVIDATGMELGTNASYSGSSVQTDSKEGIASVDDSRITALGANGTPDLIFIKMGINDAKVEDLSALGEINKIFSTPFTDTSANAFDTTTFLGAYQAMLTKIMVAYPHAKIVCLGLNWTSTVSSDDVAVASGKIAELCELYGCEYLNIRKCGITPANMAAYLSDGLHPNAAGHALMAQYITKQLQNIM